MMYYQQEQPLLTFIGSPEQLQEPVGLSQLSFPYVLLRFRPKCNCGKEFKASGQKRAEEQCIKHTSYKKYKDCKPVVEELFYDVPEFVTIDQIYRTMANQTRNAKIRELRRKIEYIDDLTYDPEYALNVMRTYHTVDGKFWNVDKGEHIIVGEKPKVIDGYQIEKNINVKVLVVSKTKPRLVKNDTLEVCEATLQDANRDKIKITLWNGDCKKIQEGQHLIIRNAYVKDGWNGGMELATYKNASTIEVVEN